MIAIVGNGNVASHLFEALKQKTEVCLVNPRTFEDFPSNPNLVLISVTDDHIKEVCNKMPQNNAIIAHTSGSVPMSELENGGENIGVFYPLQTFTKGVKLKYDEIPIFIEGSSQIVETKLKELASLISPKIQFADSSTRKKLHLASVFACNFTNALAGISEEILKDSGIDFSVMIPLMKQTVAKLDNLPPSKAQTGPASRGDLKIMSQHLEMLKSQPELKEIYARFSDLILKSKKKLQNKNEI